MSAGRTKAEFVPYDDSDVEYVTLKLRIRRLVADDMRAMAKDEHLPLADVIERELMRGDSRWLTWDKLAENLRQLDGFVKRVIERGEISERVLEQWRTAERREIMGRLQQRQPNQSKIDHGRKRTAKDRRQAKRVKKHAHRRTGGKARARTGKR